MGLFDFAADFGKKLFGKDEDPSEEIKAHIESDNPGVRNLGVAYDDGKVDLSGEADSAEVVEKTVLIAGNVQGVTECTTSTARATSRILRHTEGRHTVKACQAVSR